MSEPEWGVPKKMTPVVESRMAFSLASAPAESWDILRAWERLGKQQDEDVRDIELTNLVRMPPRL